MVERQTAIKVSVRDLLQGRYVVKEGWTPNYVETRRGRVSRANVIGAIIQQTAAGFLLDDGSGQILLRTFDQEVAGRTAAAGIGVGDAVLVIGRPREYAGERHLVYEIIKKIGHGWLAYRKRELDLLASMTGAFEVDETAARVEREGKIVDAGVAVEGVVEETGTKNGAAQATPGGNPFEKVLSTIKSLDEESSGRGAPYDEIIARSGVSGAQRILTSLLEEGEVYEAKPGRIKVLE